VKKDKWERSQIKDIFSNFTIMLSFYTRDSFVSLAVYSFM